MFYLKSIFLTLFLFSSLSSMASNKVTLIIYIDMSYSMNNELQNVARMADKIVDELGKKCQHYEIAVSNLMYQDVPSGGGELIYNEDEPIFITEKTTDGAKLLKKRITTQSKKQIGTSAETYYDSGSLEKTYSSVMETLKKHLQKSPSGLGGQGLVSALVLSDAAPMLEDASPQQALEKIKSDIPGRPFMASSLGANSLSPTNGKSCIDIPFKPGTVEYQKGVYALDSLKQFSTQAEGFHWDMCTELDVQFTIKEFLYYLLQSSQCMLIV